MCPPTNDNTRIPRHSRASQQNQSRHVPSQRLKLPTNHDDHDTASYVQKCNPGSQLTQPPPVHYPEPQVSHVPDACKLLNDMTKDTRPPSSAPREPLAMRQSASARPSSRRRRTYQELEQEVVAQLPQNSYHQAISYADRAVKKARNTLPMLSEEIGTSQQMHTLTRGNRSVSTLASSKIVPAPPILQGVNSDWERGCLSTTAGLCDTKRGKATIALQTPRPDQVGKATAQQESLGKEILTEYPGEQDLVEAMRGLKIFKGLRPGSHQPQLPLTKVSVAQMKQQVKSTAGSISSATLGTEAEHLMPSVYVNESSGAQDKPYRERGNITSRPPALIEAAENICTGAEDASHKQMIFTTLSQHSVEQGTPQVPETLPFPLQATHARTKQTIREDVIVDGKSGSMEERPKAEEPSQEASFEDVPLDSPIPDSPNSSVGSAWSGDDFEMVTTQRYQERRNGRSGVWGRWVQGKL